MAPRTAQARISESGRLSIPADMRRELGVERGGVVNLSLDENGLRVESSTQFANRIRKLARAGGWASGPTVDDFIASRRAEAAREEAESASYDRRT